MRTPFVWLTVVSAQVAQAATHATSTETLLASCLAPTVCACGVWVLRVYSRRRARLRRAEVQALREEAAALRAATPTDQREHEARRLDLEAARALADADAFDEGADALSDPGLPRSRGP